MSDEIEKTAVEEIPSKSTKGSVAWLVLAIVLIIGLFAMGAYFIYQNIQLQEQLKSSLQHEQSELDQLNAGFADVKTLSASSDAATQKMQTDLNAMNQSVKALHDAEFANKEKWTLTEAYYLVRLADDNLRFENQVPNALMLLQMADKDIADLHNPIYNDIRAALAADISALKAIPIIDMSGLYLRLATISKNSIHLPIFNKNKIAEQTTAQPVMTSWWQRAWQSFISAMQKIITVRYNEAGELPLVTPDVQMYLYQNIQSQLQLATIAVLNQQPIIYHASLEQAIEWIKSYFVVDDTVTQVFLKELDELNKIDVYPALPSLTNSLTAFEKVNQTS